MTAAALEQTTIPVPEWHRQHHPEVAKTTVWRWIRGGEIQPPPIRQGREYRLSPNARRIVRPA